MASDSRKVAAAERSFYVDCVTGNDTASALDPKYRPVGRMTLDRNSIFFRRRIGSLNATVVGDEFSFGI